MISKITSVQEDFFYNIRDEPPSINHGQQTSQVITAQKGGEATKAVQATR